MAPNDACNEMIQVEIGNDDFEEATKLKETDTPAGTTASSVDELQSKEEGEDNQMEREMKENNDEAEDKLSQSWLGTFLRSLLSFYLAYNFPIHILLGIGIAKAYPPLGAEYLQPKITAAWIATGLIFFLSGLGLKTGDLIKVIVRRVCFNAFVQGYNFGVVSLIVFGVTRALAATGILPQALADGYSIASCLPMSINAVIILTAAATGDEAAAIFHVTFGNICGIFLSPILIVTYLPSATADVNLPKVFLDLTLKVVVPLFCGQLVHITVKPARDFFYAHKDFFKKVQESSLVYIIYTIFCKTFNNKDEGDEDIGLGSIALLLLFILLCETSLMTLAWFTMRLLFHKEPGLRVMGLFGCTQKTIALGIPLILSIFGESKYVSYYTLPILMLHPMQLVIGSSLVGRLKKFMAEENKRLGIVDDVDQVGKKSPVPNAQELPVETDADDRV